MPPTLSILNVSKNVASKIVEEGERLKDSTIHKRIRVKTLWVIERERIAKNPEAGQIVTVGLRGI